MEVYLLNKFLYLLNSLNKTLKKYWKIEKNILEKSGKFVSPKIWEPWYHTDNFQTFNSLFRYLRLDGGLKDDSVLRNSQAREDRIKELTAEETPKTVDDVLSIMGDTANSRYPIWRLGKYPDFWVTMSLGMKQ